MSAPVERDHKHRNMSSKHAPPFLISGSSTGLRQLTWRRSCGVGWDLCGRQILLCLQTWRSEHCQGTQKKKNLSPLLPDSLIDLYALFDQQNNTLVTTQPANVQTSHSNCPLPLSSMNSKFGNCSGSKTAGKQQAPTTFPPLWSETVQTSCRLSLLISSIPPCNNAWSHTALIHQLPYQCQSSQQLQLLMTTDR